MSQWGEVLAAADVTPPNASSMQSDAHATLAQWRDFTDRRGRYPSGMETAVKGRSDAHDPAYTKNWAFEEMHHAQSPHLWQRATEYHDALKNMASEGPFGTHWDGTPHHEALQNAHDNLRIELQHRGRFTVPSTDQLSPVNSPDEMHANGDLVNPRYQIGMEEDHDDLTQDTASDNAYKVTIAKVMVRRAILRAGGVGEA